MANRDELSPQEQLFVEAYVAQRFNGKAAAIAAGYAKKSAAVQAVKLLGRERVQEALAVHIEGLTRDFKLSGAKVLEEMSVIAFSDFTHYTISENGHVGLTADAPPSAIRAVKKLKRKRREIPHGEAVIVEYETEIELWSKDTQLRNLGEHLGLFREPKDGEKPGEALTRAEREARVKEILRTGATRVKKGAAAT